MGNGPANCEKGIKGNDPTTGPCGPLPPLSLFKTYFFGLLFCLSLNLNIKDRNGFDY